MNLWLAWPHYGIGYIMSNGSVGELMPDKSTLFYSPCAKRMIHSSAPTSVENLQEAKTGSSPSVLPFKKTPKPLSQFLLDGLSQEEV